MHIVLQQKDNQKHDAPAEQHQLNMKCLCCQGLGGCGYAYAQEAWNKVECNPHVVPPAVSFILTSVQTGTVCRPLTEHTDIEEDKTLTFHQRLSSHHSPSVFKMVLTFPGAVAHFQLAGKVLRSRGTAKRQLEIKLCELGEISCQ